MPTWPPFQTGLRLADFRDPRPPPQPVELNRVVTEISNLLQLVVGEQIEVVLALDPEVRDVNVDLVELEQLILSLSIGGRNAMTSGGKLTVSTEVVKLDNKFIGTEDADPARWLMLE